MRTSVLDGFGVDPINQIRTENLGVWTDDFGSGVIDLITEAVELEKNFFETLVTEYQSEASLDW